MEEQKKRYKPTPMPYDGPFDGWMIEELDPDEYEKEEAREKEMAANKPAGKLSPTELEQKRQEQIAKIKSLIEKKKSDEAAQTTVAPAPSVNRTLTEAELEQKSKDTGIPIDVLRMIEKKKEEIRNKKTN